MGIVDIGWRGTIQDNLALILPNIQIHGYYLGLQRFLNKQPSNCVKTAFGPDANTSKDYLDLLDAVSVIEMLCNSPYGSVMGYEFGDKGQVVAHKLVNEQENKVFYNFGTYFQQGVLSVTNTWGHYCDAYVIRRKELRDPACRIWHELVLRPSIELSQAYAELHHNEIFGVGGFSFQRAMYQT